MEIKTCRIETEGDNAEAIVAAIPALCHLKDVLIRTAAVLAGLDPKAGGDQYVPVYDVIDAVRGALTPSETTVLTTSLLSVLGIGYERVEEEEGDVPPEGTVFFSTVRITD